MALPTFTMKNLLEAGVHYGHHPRRWNPKMSKYIFGARNNVHIINLEKTVPALYYAMQAAHDVVKGGGRVLFVGTKPQASQIIADAAKRCGQYYVNYRWLGGMITNWKTVSRSIKRLNEYDDKLAGDITRFTKKEILKLTRERDKLERAIGGIREMGGVPDMLFVVDTNKEETAVKEARVLGKPVIGIVDSNCDPTVIDYPIPGNDDASRAIEFYCEMISGAILEGMHSQLVAAGVDLGESESVGHAGTIEKEIEAAAEKSAKKTMTAKAPEKKAEPAVTEKAPAKKTETKTVVKKAEEKPAAPTKKAEAKPAAPAKKAEAKPAEAAKKESKPAASKKTEEKAPAKKAETTKAPAKAAVKKSK